MVLISKLDKQTWKNYVSNLEKTIIVPSRQDLKKLNSNISKTSEYKRILTLSNFKPRNKKSIKPDKILDLHGYDLYSGKLALSRYIINCYEKNIRTILIITGKGFNNKGVLKEEVPRWLNDKLLKKYIVQFKHAPKNFGGDGALLIKIKNKYKKQY